MTAEDEIYAALMGDTAITDIVGDRIYPDVREQEDVLPAIVFQRATTEPVITLHQTHPIDLVSFDILCMSRDDDGHESLNTLANAVIAALTPLTFIYTDRASAFNAEVGVHVTNINVNRYHQ